MKNDTKVIIKNIAEGGFKEVWIWVIIGIGVTALSYLFSLTQFYDDDLKITMLLGGITSLLFIFWIVCGIIFWRSIK